ncbi:MAG: hypothetical protein F4213_08130 [Boseongicola sp. SB0677_bin_26]|nr:hypothetical protein [Boseongicola sp. SB0677_bin_26]
MAIALPEPEPAPPPEWWMRLQETRGTINDALDNLEELYWDLEGAGSLEEPDALTAADVDELPPAA